MHEIDINKINRQEIWQSDLLNGGAWISLMVIFMYITTWKNAELTLYAFGIGFIIVILTYFLVLQRKAFFKRKKSGEAYFDMITYEKLVPRFNLLVSSRRSLVKAFIIVILIMSPLIYTTTLSPDDENTLGTAFFISPVVATGFVLYAQQIVINSFKRFNDFEYHLSASCFKLLKNYPKLRDISKTNLIIRGISSYNTFLRLNFKIRFIKPELSFSKILADSEESMSDIINEINGIFNDNNKLQFLRYLESLHKESQTSIVQFDRSSMKVQEIAPIILGPAVTILIFTISYILNFTAAIS